MKNVIKNKFIKISRFCFWMGWNNI